MSRLKPEIIEESIDIPCSEGPLRGVLAYPATGFPKQGVAIAGPHPLLGGALENNVIGAIARGAARAGWLALRFAYREPDRNRLIEQMDLFWGTGRLDEDKERIDELCAAMCALSRLAPIRCIASYSFGCWATSCLIDQLPFQIPLAMIAPTVHQHDFGPMRRHTAPKLVIGSDNDFAVSSRQLADEIQHWPEPLRFENIAGTDHFFRNREAMLEKLIELWLTGLAPETRDENSDAEIANELPGLES